MGKTSMWFLVCLIAGFIAGCDIKEVIEAGKAVNETSKLCVSCFPEDDSISDLPPTGPNQKQRKNSEYSREKINRILSYFPPFFIRILLFVCCGIISCFLQLWGWGQRYDGWRICGSVVLVFAYFLMIFGSMCVLLEGLLVWLL